MKEARCVLLGATALLLAACGESGRTASPQPVVQEPAHAYWSGCPGDQPATYRPTAIPISCADGAEYVGGLTWSYWGPDHATGTGLLNVNSCTPDCARGTATATHVSVNLSNPEPSRTQGMVFATMTVAGFGTFDIGPDTCGGDRYAKYC